MEEMTVEIALHCMKTSLCELQCQECPMYGKVGTDHCDEAAHRLAIKALEIMENIPNLISKLEKEQIEYTYGDLELVGKNKGLSKAICLIQNTMNK